MQEINSEEARRKLSPLMDQVSHGAQVTVTRFGRPLVVIVSPEWFKKAEAALAAKPGPSSGGE